MAGRRAYEVRICRLNNSSQLCLFLNEHSKHALKRLASQLLGWDPRVVTMSDSRTSAEAQGADAKTLAKLDHPMNYTNSTFKEQRPINAEELQAYLYDRRMMEDLISEYTYRVDASLIDTSNYGALNKLFTDDAEVIFPRGKYQGNAGLAEWLLAPVSELQRMSVSISLSLAHQVMTDTRL